MMEVIIPERIHPEASLTCRTRQLRVLQFVLRYDKSPPSLCCLSHNRGDFSHNVPTRRIKNLLRRIEPQSIKMKFLDPITRVGDEKLSHWPAVRSGKVDRYAPFVFVAIGKIVRRKLLEIVSIRSEVVVNDVENHAESERVRAIHECAKAVRRTIKPRRRKQIHAIVAPAEAAR